jgi:hypothetical protein
LEAQSTNSSKSSDKSSTSISLQDSNHVVGGSKVTSFIAAKRKMTTVNNEPRIELIMYINENLLDAGRF